MEEARLRERILDELHRTDDFEQCQFDRSEELIDAYEFKRKLIRKVYRLARRRGGLDSARQTKEGVLRDCEQYFNSEANVGALIRFVKQRMQLEGVMELEIDIPEEKE